MAKRSRIRQAHCVAVYRLLDDEAKERAFAWLSTRAERDLSSGLDAIGWERSTWVLHSIYEDSSPDYEATHDDLRRQRVAPDWSLRPWSTESSWTRRQPSSDARSA